MRTARPSAPCKRVSSSISGSPISLISSTCAAIAVRVVSSAISPELPVSDDIFASFLYRPTASFVTSP